MPGGVRADLTVIASAGRVTGEVAGNADVRVDGIVDGVIDSGGDVLISDGGRVTASVNGRSVTVAGTVEGNINADERIQLDPTARVVGDLVAPRILIQDGATLQGAVEMKAPPARGTRRDTASALPKDAAGESSKDEAPTPTSDDVAPDQTPSEADEQHSEHRPESASKASSRRTKRRSRTS